jgi:hypothetical protein
MIDSLDKMPRQHPIKCWGCEGDHLYKHCPHKGDRMRIVHNIQEVDTVDDMGRIMQGFMSTCKHKSRLPIPHD